LCILVFCIFNQQAAHREDVRGLAEFLFGERDLLLIAAILIPGGQVQKRVALNAAPIGILNAW
jgi:hypothetical protein